MDGESDRHSGKDQRMLSEKSNWCCEHFHGRTLQIVTSKLFQSDAQTLHPHQCFIGEFDDLLTELTSIHLLRSFCLFYYDVCPKFQSDLSFGRYSPNLSIGAKVNNRFNPFS